MRGASAVADATQQLVKHDWNRQQPFRVTVKDKKFTLEVGKKKVINEQPIDNYSPGRVLLGVYDTRYGPKKLRILSMRMRAIPGDEAAAEEP
jgi:hypothetical protein